VKITKSQLKQIIQETLEETYASDHGLEASFFSDQPGAWGETPVEHQPELEFLFSAAKGKDKEEFILANAKLLQAYDKLAASGKDREAQKVLATIKQKWTAFTKPKMKPPGAAASKGPSLGGLSAPKSKRLDINELKQIIQEELESALKEVAIVLGDKEDLGKAGPWPVKDVSTPKKAKDEFSKLTKSVQKEEEAVEEYGRYGGRDQAGDLTRRLMDYRYVVGTRGFNDLEDAKREYQSLGGDEGIYDKHYYGRDQGDWIIKSKWNR